MTLRSWSIAAITIAVLILASYTHEIISRILAYGWLHSHRPFYVAESIDKIGGWFPFMLQNVTMLLAIFITLYRTRSKVATVASAA